MAVNRVLVMCLETEERMNTKQEPGPDLNTKANYLHQTSKRKSLPCSRYYVQHSQADTRRAGTIFMEVIKGSRYNIQKYNICKFAFYVQTNGHETLTL